MRLLLATAVAAGALALAPSIASSDALETLQGMHQTPPIDWPTIPQTGPKADQIKKNLEKITMPPGFHISLYALVPDARHMAVGPQGIVTFVGTRKSKIYAVTDRARGGVAEEVRKSCRTAPVSRPTASSMSSSRIACCNIRPPNSSMRARTSRWA
jgi:hypothetical protein